MKQKIFVVVVHGSAEVSESHQSAQDFINAAKELGHSVDSVFFYGDAASITIQCEPQNSMAFLVQQRWLKLSQHYRLPLLACISTAINRGVVDSKQAEETSETVNLMNGFTLEGLGALAESIHKDHRIIEFGA